VRGLVHLPSTIYHPPSTLSDFPHLNHLITKSVFLRIVGADQHKSFLAIVFNELMIERDAGGIEVGGGLVE
jgi:hypothetical protein